MKRKTPCPRPRTLTAEEKAAGFFIDRHVLGVKNYHSDINLP